MNVNERQLTTMVEKVVAKALSNRQEVTNIIRKGPHKAIAARPSDGQSLNLRCPRTDCEFLAKTTAGLLRLGRLRCPVHHTILQTKDERGETRGRHAA